MAKAIQHANCSNNYLSKTLSVPLLVPKKIPHFVQKTKEIENTNLQLAKRLENIHKKPVTMNCYKRMPSLRITNSHYGTASNSVLINCPQVSSGFLMTLTCLVPEVSIHIVWRCLESKKMITEWAESLNQGEEISKILSFGKIKDYRSILFEINVEDIGKSIFYFIIVTGEIEDAHGQDEDFIMRNTIQNAVKYRCTLC